MYDFDVYRTPHPVIGDFIVLAGKRNFGIQSFELQQDKQGELGSHMEKRIFIGYPPDYKGLEVLQSSQQMCCYL